MGDSGRVAGNGFRRDRPVGYKRVFHSLGYQKVTVLVHKEITLFSQVFQFPVVCKELKITQAQTICDTGTFYTEAGGQLYDCCQNKNLHGSQAQRLLENLDVCRRLVHLLQRLHLAVKNLFVDVAHSFYNRLAHSG